MERESRSLGDTAFPSPFAFFVRVLVVCTAVLVFIGAMVTTTGSGLSVPDWPLSFGMLNPRMIGGVAYEHGHRAVAAGVGLLVLIAAVWASVIRADVMVRRLALLALGLVIFQGLLGGLTVKMRLPTAVSVAHGATAQIFFCTVVALLWWTSKSFTRTEGEGISPAADKNLIVATGGMTLLVLLQLVVGATMRHMGAGLVIPDFPTSLGQWIPPLASPEIAINFSHRLLGVAVATMAVLLAVRVYRFHRRQKMVVGLSGLLVALIALQITLGALAVWSARGLVSTSLHVMNGALVLATAFSLLLWSWKLQARAATPLPRRESEAVTATPAATRVSQVSRADWMDLAKVRLVTMSVFTALCGFLLSGGSFSLAGLLVAIVGVTLLGAGSSMLNHVMEVETDARMDRTRNRPIPAGRVDAALVERSGGVLVALGTLCLGFYQPWAGLLAFAAFFSYVFVYTPMKSWSPSCTVVGAVPGALPVLIGYVVRSGTPDLGGWILFAILFLWQLPHFMAIAWLCREDYARAGLPMVTVVDPKGTLASSQILIYCLALLPVSLAPTLAGMTGQLYFYCALILGVVYLYSGVLLCWRQTAVAARKLLLTSVVYLPLLYGVMVANR